MTLSAAGNVAAALAARAAEQPGREAVVSPRGGATFGGLEADAGRLASGLERAGVRAGTRVAVMVPPGPDLFATAFALFRIGAVPVLVDPGIGFGRLGRCLEEAAPEAFIGTPLAHAARLAGGWARPSLRTLVTAGRRWLWGGLTLEQLRREGPARARPPRAGGDEVAAVLFTSGSTGPPKGAVYTHAMFAAQLRLLSEHFLIRPGETSVATFPLFALFDAALGMTVVIPDMDARSPASADPRRILGPLAERGAQQLFCAPALLDRLGRYAQSRSLALKSLRRVICCGAPVHARLAARWTRGAAPQAVLHTPYGATEALPVSCAEGEELEALARAGDWSRGVCVGRPLPGVEAAIVPIRDAAFEAWRADLALPPGAVGEIAVRGPMVSPAYHGRPEATRLAKIPDGAGGVWHRMGDLGSIDAQGRLWCAGRKSQRVETARATHHTVACEAVFNQHPGVRRSALVGAPRRGATEPVLCVEAEAGAAPGRLVAELLELASRHEHTRAIREAHVHPAFPVDVRHNSKIDREALAAWVRDRRPGAGS